MATLKPVNEGDGELRTGKHSVHPRVADQEALKPSRKGTCPGCGEEIWIADYYPDDPEATRMCGYCVLPLLSGEHKRTMQKLLGIPSAEEAVH